MEMQKNLEKLGCSFYKVEGTDVQVCITSGKDWKDIAPQIRNYAPNMIQKRK